MAMQKKKGDGDDADTGRIHQLHRECIQQCRRQREGMLKVVCGGGASHHCAGHLGTAARAPIKEERVEQNRQRRSHGERERQRENQGVAQAPALIMAQVVVHETADKPTHADHVRLPSEKDERATPLGCLNLTRLARPQSEVRAKANRMHSDADGASRDMHVDCRNVWLILLAPKPH